MPQTTGSQSRCASRVLLFLCISFMPCACGHTEAAPPEIPMPTLVQAIHSYGAGRQGTPVPVPASPSTETSDTYRLYVRNFLLQGNYGELEKIVQTNRTERGLLVAGDWKLNDFYNAVVYPLSNSDLTDADYLQQIDRLKKWQAARPDSAAAKIALAQLYIDYADFARGTGYADSVGSNQWRLYHQRTALAKQLLLAAASLKERDPQWYSVMGFVANNDGWDKTLTHDLFQQALAFEPSYFHYYRIYANYLLPRWYGDSGDIQSLAEDVSAKIPEPGGSILYFQILSSLACYCDQDIPELRHADWSKLHLGFTNLDHYYGTSNLNANRYAEMAEVFADRGAAQEAFEFIQRRDTSVWIREQDFDNARDWAHSVDSQ